MIDLVIATHEAPGVHWGVVLTTLVISLLTGAMGGAGFAYVLARMLNARIDEKLAEIERLVDST